MKYDLSPFLWIGTILATFNSSSTILTLKQLRVDFGTINKINYVNY